MSSKYQANRRKSLFSHYVVEGKNYLDHEGMKVAINDLFYRLGTSVSEMEADTIVDEALEIYSKNFSEKLYFEDFSKFIDFLEVEKGLTL